MTQAPQANGWDGLLAPGETVLWQGQPIPGIAWVGLMSADAIFGAVITLFSLFWLGFSAILITTMGTPAVFMIFPLVGLPFLAIGLYMLFGRLFVDAARRRGTWYTVTDQRAFIAEDALGRRSLQSYPIIDMRELSLIDDMPGDVRFGQISASRSIHPVDPRRRQRLVTNSTTQIGFFRIAEARVVWRLLRDRRVALRALAQDPKPEGII